MGSATGQRAKPPEASPERRPVEDGTAYWTLSFYISRAQIIGHDLAMQLDPADFVDTEWREFSPDELVDKFSIDTYFTRHPKWTGMYPRKALDQLRTFAANDVRKQAARADKVRADCVSSHALRAAINPLFNDIADRSRLGRIEDQLFATRPSLIPEGQTSNFTFTLPPEVSWSTEGRTFTVPIDDDARDYPAHVTRFWYLHGNGAMSWHISFEVKYRDDRLAERLKAGKTPAALYLLSLMQKLAYPKEKEIDEGKTMDSDELFGLSIAGANPPDGDERFWSVVKSWFEADKTVIASVFDLQSPDLKFPKLCPHIAINEIPGLFCLDTRSNFFLCDQEFFGLIQPKVKNGEQKGELVERRTRILDPEFEECPKLVDPKPGVKGALLRKDGQTVELGDAYWQRLLSTGEKPEIAEDAILTPEERLLYLFLAGFNQNIIDWTNQEASEVLDSLDPIYPKSEEQLEEGFFIRYANPRCLITYVQRSRTLEVGNDFIGTCPYAFLIHVLAMHNERLTRDQEKLAFAVVEKVNDYLRAAQAKTGPGKRDVAQLIRDAEEWINWYRIAAFEHFDRHRYINPFRYDTERDVFDVLEQLRGTSRLAAALDKAFAALDESTRDLERVRADAEAAGESRRSLFLTVVFGIVGFAGLAQVVLQVDQMLREPNHDFTTSEIIADVGITFGIGGLLAVFIGLLWVGIPLVRYLFQR